MDATNHHLHKPVMIGEIEGNGQFNVVWQTDEPVRAQPWEPVDPGNDKKPDHSGENRQPVSATADGAGASRPSAADQRRTT
ncbi:Urea ABC transporter [Klebsiella pneumoniae]|uniref:Urea ABC transporter n=1 Tax=Klebsiella pneumoniae TaxID=573 RepID=A0A2X3EKR7_KLEPN|nr:Urea ABC transporter [Klebsiella pneumoniae]